MKFLKTNTAVRLAVGPFLDKADGFTPKTALTVTGITCELYKDLDDGNAVGRTTLSLTASGGNNDMVHITNDVAGYYDLELTAANLNFLGRMTLVFTDTANILPVFLEFMVLPATVYPALVAGSSYFQADVANWKGSAAPAMTGDAYARLGAPAGASVSADVAAVKLDSGAIKAKTDNLPAAPAAVGSAMTLTAAYDPAKSAAPENGGNLAAIKAKTDNLPAAPANESTLAAVKGKTDNLPNDPADQSAVEAALTAAISSVKGADGDDLRIISEQIDGIAGGGASAADIWTYAPRTLTAGPKDAEIDAIKAKTDGLPADPASQAAVLAAIAGLGDLTVGELLAGDLSDHLSFPAGSLADLLRKLFWTLCNRLVINDATGAFTAYKSDGVTPALTGAITDNGAATERSAPAWP